MLVQSQQDYQGGRIDVLGQNPSQNQRMILHEILLVGMNSNLQLEISGYKICRRYNCFFNNQLMWEQCKTLDMTLYGGG